MVWYVAGHMAGTAINRAVVGSQRRAIIRQALNPGGAAVLQPILDIDRIVSDRYYFQFGVPWGWFDFTDDQVQMMTAEVGLNVVAGVVANRLDASSARLMVFPFPVTEDEWPQLFLDPDQMMRARMSRLPNARAFGQPIKVLVGGELGLLFYMIGDVPGALRGHPECATVPVVYTELLFRHQGQGFFIECDAGAEHHERYMACIWTMLGSWRWLR
jgi:hypothetical protein